MLHLRLFGPFWAPLIEIIDKLLKCLHALHTFLRSNTHQNPSTSPTPININLPLLRLEVSHHARTVGRCVTGSVSVDECEAYSRMKGGKWSGRGSWEVYPPGCFHRFPSSDNYVYFNTYSSSTGRCSRKSQCVCMDNGKLFILLLSLTSHCFWQI